VLQEGSSNRGSSCGLPALRAVVLFVRRREGGKREEKRKGKKREKCGKFSKLEKNSGRKIKYNL
jgi:hypothetical protein